MDNPLTIEADYAEALENLLEAKSVLRKLVVCIRAKTAQPAWKQLMLEEAIAAADKILESESTLATAEDHLPHQHVFMSGKCRATIDRASAESGKNP